MIYCKLFSRAKVDRRTRKFLQKNFFYFSISTFLVNFGGYNKNKNKQMFVLNGSIILKVKRLLRFYYSVRSLERAFDNLIMKFACTPCGDGEKGAEKILKIIAEKCELSKLWNYIDGVVVKLSPEERRALKTYAALRCGVKKLDDERRKTLRRSVMKFTRHARRIESFCEGIRLVNKYYCVISPCA